MNELLKHILIILGILIILAMMLSESPIEFYRNFDVTSIGTIKKMFPKKSKGVTTKLPVQRDLIVDIQKLDKEEAAYNNISSGFI